MTGPCEQRASKVERPGPSPFETAALRPPQGDGDRLSVSRRSIVFVGGLKLNLALVWNVNKSREEGDLLGLAHAPDRGQRIRHRRMRPAHDPVGDEGRAK